MSDKKYAVPEEGLESCAEPSVPEEIKDLFLKEKEDDSDWDTCCRANKAISEAFRRGQAQK
jgi:hypothetical protein